MSRKKKMTYVCSTLLLSSVLVSPAMAAPSEQRAEAQTQQYATSAFISHAELSKKLKQIDKSSQGQVQVDVVGYSNQGREIYKATVGSGDKVILLQSEIHGNEKTGTAALLKILQQLGSNSPEAEKIRSEVTIVAMPMVNPDATELNRRGNDM